MASFLAAGTTATTSSDFALASGESATLFLVDADGTDGLPSGAIVEVQLKSAAGQYFTVGSLSYAAPAQVLEGVGTYRLKRALQLVAIGVDKE